MKTLKVYDAVVIGGGHNGLVTAAYLARAGKKVAVLERRHVLGGCSNSDARMLVIILVAIEIPNSLPYAPKQDNRILGN